MSEPDWTQFPNFSRHEFECHCGKCGLAVMNDEFVHELQEMRTKLGFAFKITSGFRCSEHNNAVSHTGLMGPHTTGRAVDIAVAHGEALALVREALERGFERIGLNQKGPGVQRFIHLDRSKVHPTPAIWTY